MKYYVIHQELHKLVTFKLIHSKSSQQYNDLFGYKLDERVAIIIVIFFFKNKIFGALFADKSAYNSSNHFTVRLNEIYIKLLGNETTTRKAYKAVNYLIFNTNYCYYYSSKNI